MSELIDNEKDNEDAELKRLLACLMDILDSIYKTLGNSKISFTDFSRLIRSMI